MHSLQSHSGPAVVPVMRNRYTLGYALGCALGYTFGYTFAPPFFLVQDVQSLVDPRAARLARLW